MKKVKKTGVTSIVCVLTAIALVICMVCFKSSGENSSVFQPDSSYITAKNIALNKGVGSAKKLTDGDTKTSFKKFDKKQSYIDIDLEKTESFNCIVLKEDGLNIKDFSVLVSNDNKTFTQVYHGDKIEYHRLCTFDDVNARYIRIFINESNKFFNLKEIEVYNQEKVNSDNFRMTGYVVNNDFYEILNNAEIKDKNSAVEKMLAKHNFAGMTHVNFYCGISFDENGNVFVGDPKGNQQKQKEELRYMVEAMRKYGKSDLKIVGVMGISTGNPATNIAMGDNRDAFVENLISFANEFGFDGIDIDYEFPQSDNDYKIFGDFLVELKNQMILKMNTSKQPILSCAFGTKDINYPKEVIDAIDIVNVMTYDIFDQDGQHSSFWSCAVQGAEYIEELGFPKEKINIGIPFYGTQVDALMEQYIYKDIESFDYFENTYTFNSYLDGSPTQVYFNSPAMVRDKTAYALLNEYGGIMVWHFSCDTDYSSEYSLWRAAYTAVNQFGGAK